MGGVRDRRGEYGRGYGEERCIWEGLGRGNVNLITAHCIAGHGGTVAHD